jgi:hypothetical protein
MDHHRPPPGHDAVPPLPRAFGASGKVLNQKDPDQAWDEGSRSARPLMTINMSACWPAPVASRSWSLREHSEIDCAIVVRAIRRLLADSRSGQWRTWPRQTACSRASGSQPLLLPRGLDDGTFLQTIRWFARKACGIMIAMLEQRGSAQARSTRDCSLLCLEQAQLLVAQLRHELRARLRCAEPERIRLLGRARGRRHCGDWPSNPVLSIQRCSADGFEGSTVILQHCRLACVFLKAPHCDAAVCRVELD